MHKRMQNPNFRLPDPDIVPEKGYLWNSRERKDYDRALKLQRAKSRNNRVAPSAPPFEEMNQNTVIGYPLYK